MMNSSILAILDLKWKMQLETNISGYAIGRVLS